MTIQIIISGDTAREVHEQMAKLTLGIDRSPSQPAAQVPPAEAAAEAPAQLKAEAPIEEPAPAAEPSSEAATPRRRGRPPKNAVATEPQPETASAPQASAPQAAVGNTASVPASTDPLPPAVSAAEGAPLPEMSDADCREVGKRLHSFIGMTDLVKLMEQHTGVGAFKDLKPEQRASFAKVMEAEIAKAQAAAKS